MTGLAGGRGDYILLVTPTACCRGKLGSGYTASTVPIVLLSTANPSLYDSNDYRSSDRKADQHACCSTGTGGAASHTHYTRFLVHDEFHY